MSRAFVKETDDAPPPPLPERPISAAPNRVTPHGAQLIKEAVAALEVQLAATPAGEAARALRRDLRYWLSRSATMQVVPPRPGHRVAGFGAWVTIQRGGTLRRVAIVGEDEADPSSGLIAWTAPLARILEGAEPGDVVELGAGGRLEAIAVVAVSGTKED